MDQRPLESIHVHLDHPRCFLLNKIYRPCAALEGTKRQPGDGLTPFPPLQRRGEIWHLAATCSEEARRRRDPTAPLPLVLPSRLQRSTRPRAAPPWPCMAVLERGHAQIHPHNNNQFHSLLYL
jgi:hypothetical protein